MSRHQNTAVGGGCESSGRASMPRSTPLYPSPASAPSFSTSPAGKEAASKRGMGFHISLSSFLLLLAFLLHPARSDDTSTQLLSGLNKYRGSLNLSSLTDNSNADCLAEQVALAFKGQDCSNSTGSYTVPGTETQLPNFPNYLSTCHLNATVTRDGSIMPVCVQGLASDLVLSNYTETQYNQYLNDSSFAGIGIADEGDWVVVVLTTDTPTGNYAPAVDTTSSSAIIVATHLYTMLLLLGFALFFIS